MTRECYNCIFFERSHTRSELHAGYGNCRRYPPLALVNKQALSPKVSGDNWCGEFKPMTEMVSLAAMIEDKAPEELE